MIGSRGSVCSSSWRGIGYDKVSVKEGAVAGKRAGMLGGWVGGRKEGRGAGWVCVCGGAPTWRGGLREEVYSFPYPKTPNP